MNNHRAGVRTICLTGVLASTWVSSAVVADTWLPSIRSVTYERSSDALLGVNSNRDVRANTQLLAIGGPAKHGDWRAEFVGETVTEESGVVSGWVRELRSVALIHTFQPMTVGDPVAFRVGLRIVDYAEGSSFKQALTGVYGGVALGLPLAGNRLSAFGTFGYHYLVGDEDANFHDLVAEAGVTSRLTGAIQVRAGLRFRQRELGGTALSPSIDEEGAGTFAGIRVGW